MDTMLIQITNPKTRYFLHELEELHLIKVLKGYSIPAEAKLSEKYKNVFSQEDASDFNAHTQTMRGEWNNI
ncbi:MAG: hypothetical protein LBV75_05330 [Paludibacter sp.]|jgi:hypothetical protein|nr:hypothetical protein [Paludibacter sp.]